MEPPCSETMYLSFRASSSLFHSILLHQWGRTAASRCPFIPTGIICGHGCHLHFFKKKNEEIVRGFPPPPLPSGLWRTRHDSELARKLKFYRRTKSSETRAHAWVSFLNVLWSVRKVKDTNRSLFLILLIVLVLRLVSRGSWVEQNSHCEFCPLGRPTFRKACEDHMSRWTFNYPCPAPRCFTLHSVGLSFVIIFFLPDLVLSFDFIALLNCCALHLCLIVLTDFEQEYSITALECRIYIW